MKEKELLERTGEQVVALELQIKVPWKVFFVVTLVGLITKNDETNYRKEIDLLTTWCNNLLLNVNCVCMYLSPL